MPILTCTRGTPLPGGPSWTAKIVVGGEIGGCTWRRGSRSQQEALPRPLPILLHSAVGLADRPCPHGGAGGYEGQNICSPIDPVGAWMLFRSCMIPVTDHERLRNMAGTPELSSRTCNRLKSVHENLALLSVQVFQNCCTSSLSLRLGGVESAAPFLR